MFKPKPQTPETSRITLYSINTKCKYLQDHFDLVENLYQEELSNLWENEKAESEKTKYHADDSEYNYTYAQNIDSITHTVLRVHRYSATLASYSYLENTMCQLCKECHESMQLPGQLSDIQGNGIEKFKLYLEKLAKIDFTSANTQWSQLQNLNKIRNCIIHADGNIDNITHGTKKLKNIIRNNNNLSLYHDQLIMIEAPYIHLTIQTIKDFLIHLLNAIR